MLTDADRQAIVGLERHWVAAELAGPHGAVLDFCTDDVVWMPPSERPIRGRAAILAWLGRPTGRIERIDLTTVCLEGDGSIAYKAADYRTRFVPEGRTEPVTSTGAHLWTLRKGEDSTWRVAVVAWSVAGDSRPAPESGSGTRRQSIAHVALVVRDYDEAIAFFTGVLGFSLVEDTYVPEQDKRWVLVAPPGSAGTSLVLARPSTPGQEAFVGNQTGGRVTFFLRTDDFWRDYTSMRGGGIEFVRAPVAAPYGTVAVFRDLYGNLWDLVGPADAG